MELALSLGDASRSLTNFTDKPVKIKDNMGFCMGLGALIKEKSQEKTQQQEITREDVRRASSDPPVQLDLLPFSPVQRYPPPPPSHLRFSWLMNLCEPAGSNRVPEEAGVSSPNSGVSSFQMELSLQRNKRDFEMTMNEVDGERASSRASDDDENGLTRKKLRLSKEQSAFLEESFKEHNTLNPKQKLALAKQLDLRPRQVEVWFQNRRARTKLKQTEVDCEYLKRCCETLTEENRRLQKELQELRALKTCQPFYMQLPATTLTMCPSCERVAPTTTTTTAANATTTVNGGGSGPNLSLSDSSKQPKLNNNPFFQVQGHVNQVAS
ncbi:Leucine zipper, homeobox-associated [Dillenia turbinata]|uniref:Leucine zipper, homeobox-associated n=1 Tax=Dillenia turbinata TaxID=194707 RepID=A0AAN8VX80_9MAGN